MSRPGGNREQHHQHPMAYPPPHAWPTASTASTRRHRRHHAASPQSLIVTDNDVLSGRGVNIAQHPGNERFRVLVQSHYDPAYCTQYTAMEKRMVALEIISHIKALNPPGRFLKRPKGGSKSQCRGFDGPWEELTDPEVVKKTCQALRDCNRQDRTGYASQVAIPEDVLQQQAVRSQSGLSGLEHAMQASESRQHQYQMLLEGREQQQMDQLEQQHEQVARQLGKRDRSSIEPLSNVSAPVPSIRGSISPSIEQGAVWLKRQRMDSDRTPNLNTTPTTAASSGGILHDSSLLDTSTSSGHSLSAPHHHHDPAVAAHPGFLNMEHSHSSMPPPSPAAAATATTASTFQEQMGVSFSEAFLPQGSSLKTSPASGEEHSAPDLDPLQLAAAAIEGSHQYLQQLSTHHHHHHDTAQCNLCADGDTLGGIDHDDDHHDDDFPPPSPFHPDNDDQEEHQHGDMGQDQFDE